MGGVQFYRDRDLPFCELKLCDTSALSYKKHSHEEYSLGLVDKGTSSFWYEGKLAKMQPEALVIIPPNLVHSCNPHQEDHWQYKMLYLQPNWVRGFMESVGKQSICYPIIKEIALSQKYALNQMMEKLVSPLSPLEKEAMVLSIFEQGVQGEPQIRKRQNRKEKPKLKIIMEYLQSCFLERITLEQLEKMSGLNKYYIIRSFCEEFNIPPHTYQTLLRVNYAKKELLKQRQVAEVAQEAGFYDQSHFVKVFKSYTGITPNGYQNLV